MASSVATVVEVGALVVVIYGVARLRPRPGRGWRPSRPGSLDDRPSRGGADPAPPTPEVEGDPDRSAPPS